MHYGAKETFRYWAGQDPWEGIEVYHGQYWASAHWSKEYELYMELTVPVKTAKNFVDGNGLKEVDKKGLDKVNGPDWFKPPKEYAEFDGQQGSKYYINLKTGHMFMFERQM